MATLNERVVQELAFFSDARHLDRELRAVYQNMRLSDLAHKTRHPTALETAQRAVEFVRTTQPDFEPAIDRDGLAGLEMLGR